MMSQMCSSEFGKGDPVNSISGSIEQELANTLQPSEARRCHASEGAKSQLDRRIVPPALTVVPNVSQANQVSTRRAVRPCRESSALTFSDPQQNDASGRELSAQLLQTLSCQLVALSVNLL